MSNAFGFRYVHENPFSMEYSCGVCSRVSSEQELDSMIVCEGGCKRIYHMECIGISSLPDAGNWACSRCVSRLKSCHVCDGAERVGSMVTCSVAQCGKHFHKDCLIGKYGGRPIEAGAKLLCPLHQCGIPSCTQSINDESYFCIFCLTAYHLRCMPEVVQVVCENVCVCVKHQFVRKRGGHYEEGLSTFCQKLLSVGYGVSLVKKRRNDDMTTNTGSSSTGSTATPDDCEEELIPAAAVVSLSDSSLSRFTTVSHLRQFQYPFKVNAELGSVETVARENVTDKSGLDFVRIRTNEWTCPRSKKGVSDFDPSFLCGCKELCGEDCHNKVTFTECDELNCSIMRLGKNDGIRSSSCGNRYFSSKREKKPFSVVEAGSKGMGVRATGLIRKGDFIIEYIGEVLTISDWTERKEREGATPHFYTMELDNGHVVDASRKGNESRLINHSCEPNLETQKWTVREEPRIGLFAIRDVNPGEELTFNYQFETHSAKPFKCLCGTAGCTGWIGGRRRDADKVIEKSSVNRKTDSTAISSVLPLSFLQNFLAKAENKQRHQRSDGTRKKESEIEQEEWANCNEWVNYFLQFLWTNGKQSGELWALDGKKCASLERTPVFNPGPFLAFQISKAEASYLRHRQLVMVRVVNSVRRETARRMMSIETFFPLKNWLETNLLAEDCCLRCRRTTTEVLKCSMCLRAFHKSCLSINDLLIDRGGGSAYSLTCRRCRGLRAQNKLPPIRLSAQEAIAVAKKRRTKYWQETVLPDLFAGKYRKRTCR